MKDSRIKDVIILLLTALLCITYMNQPKLIEKVVEKEVPIYTPVTTIKEVYIGITPASKQVELISLGRYKLTAYCPCKKCCGKNAKGITASGTVATANRTIGVNPKIIPYGTSVYINGQEYVAEDTGSGLSKKHIDVFFNTHSEAILFGVQYAEVYIAK